MNPKVEIFPPPKNMFVAPLGSSSFWWGRHTDRLDNSYEMFIRIGPQRLVEKDAKILVFFCHCHLHQRVRLDEMGFFW